MDIIDPLCQQLETPGSDSTVHCHAERREGGRDVSIIAGQSFNLIPPCFSFSTPCSPHLLHVSFRLHMRNLE